MARILIVEDEPIAALRLRESLESMGHAILDTMASGDGVLEAVAAGRPDLVIMDIHLKSFIDGVDAAARIKLLRPVPIIFLTGYSGKGTMERAMKVGPAAYLVKPVSDAALRDSVERALLPGEPVRFRVS
jgi:two-component system, response regulator PdtaR